MLNIGLNPAHEKYREQYRNQISDILKKSYSKIGGYGGHSAGSDAEHKDLHADISKHLIKATVRSGKITAVNVYKKQFGRKSIASGTDGSEQGKKDFLKQKIEDHQQKRAWGEVSGAVEKIQHKVGYPTVDTKHVEKLVKKRVDPINNTHYIRNIAGQPHKKTVMGYPKDE